MKELQIETILNRAKHLKNVTSEELARKVLEIDVDARSAQQQDLLIRLIRSLEQYVNKQQSLIYIGFVGHFSSGKSSTINTLLNLHGTVHERETGLNPTDKVITLLTHERNSNSLILMNRETASVPVRTSYIENELLETLVIADTPGAGDPQIVNEMIQDFLPICDYIFYFIQATNPLDQADLPLLKQKTFKLPFIPILFIVTRFDEFRIDKTQGMEEKNIDFKKKDEFIGRLIARIKENIGTSEVALDDFIFIDNNFRFGINSIIEKLRFQSSKVDELESFRIHGYKIEYYRTDLDSIYHFYGSSIEDKIKKSKEFLDTAKENIARFDKSIEINNEKLKLLWAKSENQFKFDFTSELNALDNTKKIELPTFLIRHREIETKKIEILRSLESHAYGYLGNIVTNLNNHFRERLRDFKYSILEKISNVEIPTNINNFFPSNLGLEYSQKSLEIDFYKLNDYAKSYEHEICSVINSSKDTLRTKIQNFRIHINKEQLIRSLTELYVQGNAAINENFSEYFEKIHLYRNTVLTKNTRKTIEKLRIGKQLDELNDEFADDYVTAIKNKAVDEVYVALDDEINHFKHFIEKNNSIILDLTTNVDKVEPDRNSFKQQFAKEIVDVSKLITHIVQDAELIINAMYRSRLEEVLENHRQRHLEYSKTINAFRKKRKRTIIKWVSLLGFIAVLTYVGLRFINVINPSTILSDIVIGLVSTGIGNIIGLIVGNFKFDIKKISVESKTQFDQDNKLKLMQFFDEAFWDTVIKKSIEDRGIITNPILKDIFNSRMLPAFQLINESNQAVLEKLLSEDNTLTVTISSYHQKLEHFYRKFLMVFTQVDTNLEKIGVITRQIKEVAIKPSFDLLNETADKLEKVKLRMQNI